MTDGWYGVDLDGTLAEYHGWPADGSIGSPVPAMVERVKRWHAEGREVRIVTARVAATGRVNAEGERDDWEFADAQKLKIRDWCLAHLGFSLPVTCKKDMQMETLWDDRCVQVEPNTGRRMDGGE
mgnify:FL=1